MKTVRRNSTVFPSIFEGLFTENRLDVPNYEKFSIPAVNISEKSTNFVLEIAIPGIDKNDIAIEVEENTLTVSSREELKQSDEKEKNEDSKFTHKEFYFGKFKRVFTLPETANSKEINAAYNAGILTITVPKMEKKVLKKMVEIS
ncbi:Hsp20/alpha crystallin family protein [Rasiella rasia]|uniref:Hsp20/alpha crystallin family protein n=1 Tax=Rasiella rasia TaxID=2744027 RepID=A0A6G6GK41_9FLAO|nr:Hsp20/alpha crystallin family protein [Rasiella rasia]QIE58945.1 Hsp20/alpha crystallin family protein [Rasiella rasia]